MCDEIKASRTTRIIRNVRYEICPTCGKPIRGTGKTVGGHAIFVTKRYVKGGKIVEFSDRWQSLCESVGFKLVCRHQAMLVENHGTKTSLMGVDEEINTERKSFFRRLAEKKGSPRIDFEDVICLRKKG